MKATFRLILVLLSAAALSSCAFMGQEDRDFYGKGWINPRELDDRPVPQMPDHPETTGALGGPTDQGPASTATRPQDPLY